MDSIGKQCTILKKEYDECFNKWYTEKFLKGDVTPECKHIFEKYQECVQNVLKERGIQGLIDEVRDQKK
ncbi:hypothetical protein K502DRAFT_44235 [Neoconidiobolus thromboides FSU 785]|nr:hypothetical protein K502DRAFT_44235 [Neoconidiobolus thromboides FSU 785]